MIAFSISRFRADLGGYGTEIGMHSTILSLNCEFSFNSIECSSSVYMLIVLLQIVTKFSSTLSSVDVKWHLNDFVMAVGCLIVAL